MTAVEYYQYKNAEASLDKKLNYRRHFLKMLGAMSKLGKGDRVEVKRPANPLKGHRSVRLSLAGGTRNEHDFQTLSFRPSFHDLTDNDDGFIKGTHIEFFNTEISNFNDEVRIERMNLLAIESFSPRNAFFKPTAWRIKVAWDREFKDDEIRPTVWGGSGLSWGNDYGFIYINVDAKAYYKTYLDTAVSGSFGGVWDQGSKAKMVFETSYSYFDDGFHQRINSASQNITLAQNHALSLSYKSIQKSVGDDEQILFHYKYYY